MIKVSSSVAACVFLKVTWPTSPNSKGDHSLDSLKGSNTIFLGLIRTDRLGSLALVN